MQQKKGILELEEAQVLCASSYDYMSLYTAQMQLLEILNYPNYHELFFEISLSSQMSKL